MVFLEGADNKHFHGLKCKLKNNFLAGDKKSHPKTLDDMTTLMINYQAPWMSTRPRQEETTRPPPTQTSFHQQSNHDDDEISDYESVSCCSPQHPRHRSRHFL